MKLSELKEYGLERVYVLDNNYKEVRQSQYGILGTSKQSWRKRNKHSYIHQEIADELIELFLSNKYKQVPVGSEYYPLGFYKRTNVEYFELTYLPSFEDNDSHLEGWFIYKKGKIK
jgi:hypothetical protein